MRVAFVAFALVAALHSQAQACDYVDAHGLVLGQPAGLELPLPRNGVVVFPAWSVDMGIEEALAFVSVYMTGDAEPVPGAIEAVELLSPYAPPFPPDVIANREFHSFAMVWRSAEELEPETEYRLSVLVDHGEIENPWAADLDLSFDLTTGVGLAAPVRVPELVDVSFYPGSLPTGERVCCEPSYGECPQGLYACTELRSKTNVPFVFFAALIEGEVAEHGAALVTAEAVFPSGSRIPLADVLMGEPLESSFELSMLEGSRVCGGATAVSLIDGSTASTGVICPPDTDYGPVVEKDRDPADWLEQCSSDPFYEESGEPYPVPDTSSSFGCRSHGDRSAAWWLTLLGFVFWRRPNRP